jgi:hypothetical protein
LENRKFNSAVIGIGLVAAGVLLLLTQYNFFSMFNIGGISWLILAGLALVAVYYFYNDKKQFLEWGLLLIFIAIFNIIVFYCQQYYGLGYQRLWPGFLIAIGLSGALAAILHKHDFKGLTSSLFSATVGVGMLVYTTGLLQLEGVHSIVLFVGLAMIFVGVKLTLDSFLSKEKQNES